MKLSVVIPVRNDPAGLDRLLGHLARLRIARQIVVVDDGSDPPLQAAFARHRVPGAQLDWLRSDAGLGAGHARNLGQAAVRGTHVLFCDADDELTPEIVPLLADLRHQSFDFALFMHHDSRMLASGRDGPHEPPDRAFWHAVSPPDRPRAVDMAEAAVLCRISNYPWNKIWRAGFLREAHVRCTEIPVHNDIEPHWAGFLSARRILVSGRHCLIHHVAAHHGQLSNRRGAGRLALFEALEAVLERLTQEVGRTPGQSVFVAPFMEFCCRLLDWTTTRLEPELHPELQRRACAFFQQIARSPEDTLAAAAQTALATEPGLASRLLTLAGEGG